MPNKSPLENGRNSRGQFIEGNKSSRGRKTGSRKRSSLIAQQLFEDQAQAVIMAVVNKALEGDMVAAKIVIERLLPPCRERPLPPVDLRSAPKAAIRELLANGELTPTELASLCKASGLGNLDDDFFKIL